MKISEVSDEVLSRWIAEKSEPRATRYYRDFVNDPEMTVMLLKSLCAKTRSALGMIQNRMDDVPGNQDLQRTIAEAFALANGWPE